MSANSTANNTFGGNAKIKRIIFGMIAVAAVAICTVVGLTGCGKPSDDGKKVVKIGAILPLTGKFANVGNAMKAGLERATREIQSDRNTVYKIEYYDTQSEAKNALTGYNRLKNINKINVFFTAPSDHAFAFKPEIIKDGGLLFAVAPHLEITKDNEQLVFQPFNSSENESAYLLQYVFDELKSERLFVYSHNTEAGATYANYFQERLGADLVGICLFEEDAAMLRNISTANTYKNADCIMVCGLTSGMGLLIKFIRENGYSGPIVSNIGFSFPAVLASAGDYSKSVTFVDYDFPYASSQHKAWNDGSLSAYNTSFTFQAYLAYGALCIFDDIYASGVCLPEEIGKHLSVEQTYIVKAGEESFEMTTHTDGGITARLRMNSTSETK